MRFLERGLDQQNQWWKYLVVIFVGIILGSIVVTIPFFAFIFYTVSKYDLDYLPKLEELATIGVSKNLVFMLEILPFAVILFFTLYFIKSLHKRSYKETINGTNKLRYGRMWAGFAVWTILIAVFSIGDYLINPSNFVVQFDLIKILPLLLISLLLVPLQTTYEEVLFRGYLAQGVASLTRNRIMVILLPGILFGLLHIGNPEVKEYGFALSMSQYMFFGLLFGLIAVLDDGIELPIGMHAANNIFCALFITHNSSAFQTNAILEQLSINPFKDAISLYITGVIVVIYFAYKYKWNFKILTKKIEKPDNL